MQEIGLSVGLKEVVFSVAFLLLARQAIGLGIGIPLIDAVRPDEGFEAGDALLLEPGDYLLLEPGDKLLLE